MDTKMNRELLIKGWSLCVGTMDAITGFLLVFAPGVVLKLLGISPPDETAMVFLSWMGVFITGVGLSYAWALRISMEGALVWKVTSMIRFMVAAFISWKVGTGELERAWLLVALSDAAVAVVQLQILRLGWWREVDI